MLIDILIRRLNSNLKYHTKYKCTINGKQEVFNIPNYITEKNEIKEEIKRQIKIYNLYKNFIKK